MILNSLFIFLVSIDGLHGVVYNGSDIFVNTINAKEIECNEGADCTVECHGDSIVCGSDSSITCPTNANCDIYCNGTTSCQDGNVYCPTESGNTCNIYCGDNDDYYRSESSCKNMILHANTTTYLNVYCNGDNSCNNVKFFNQDGLGIFNIYSLEPWEYDYESTGTYAIGQAEIYAPDFGELYIEITGYQTGSTGIIYGGIANKITIKCEEYDEFNYDIYNISEWTASSTCALMKIYAKDANLLELYGGPNAFKDSWIECPSNQTQGEYVCKFYGVRPLGSWSSEFADDETARTFSTYYKAEIYSQFGYYDIGIYCNDKLRSGDENDYYTYDFTSIPNVIETYPGYLSTCIDWVQFKCFDMPFDGSDGSCSHQLVAGDPLPTPTATYQSGNKTWSSKEWNGYDFICGGEYGVDYTDATHLVDLYNANLYFGFTCIQIDSANPSPSPTNAPTSIPTRIPTSTPTSIPTQTDAVVPVTTMADKITTTLETPTNTTNDSGVSKTDDIFLLWLLIFSIVTMVILSW